jgi:signal recognition particle subunit SRP54
MPGLGNMPSPENMDPRELEQLARRMGIDPASLPQQAPDAAPKQLAPSKLPTDVGQLLKSGSGGLPGLGGAARFPGLPGLGGGFVPKKK